MRVATERLYRTADGRVVREGDPEAAFLLAAVGSSIPDGVVLPDDVVAGEADDLEVVGNDHEDKAVAAPDEVKSDDQVDQADGDVVVAGEADEPEVALTPAQKAAVTRARHAAGKTKGKAKS